MAFLKWCTSTFLSASTPLLSAPMEPALKDPTDVACAKPSEEEQGPENSTSMTAVDSGAIAPKEDVGQVHETKSTTEKRLDADMNAQSQQAEDIEMKGAKNEDTEQVIADDSEEHAKQEEVMMEPASVDPVDHVSPDQSETINATAVTQGNECVETNDVVETKNSDSVNATAHAVEEAATTDGTVRVKGSELTHSPIEAAPDEVLDDLAKYADLTSPIVPEVTHPVGAGHEDAKDATNMTAENDKASSSPVHAEDNYDPSAPAMIVDSVPHSDDEYDPAKPSPAATSVDTKTAPGFASQRSTAEQEEYDPDHPSMTSSLIAAEPMEVTHTSSENTNEEQSVVTPAKRESAELDASDQTNGDPGPKRPRHDSNSSHASNHDNHKTGRPRRESGDSTSSVSSRHKHQKEDHKGLSAAAWDRLMDFQASGEFQVTQVSRAAFASVGAMPEFAQIAIIARFVRTPMKEVRDKNGQLMRIYREYQKENPQIAALQPVDVFISDYKNDSGLFRFGYAPPQPTTGVSTVQVPYQWDPIKEGTLFKNSPRQTRSTTSRSELERHKTKDVDEFGRVVHADKSGAPESNGSFRTPGQRPAVEHRTSVPQSRQASSPQSSQATAQSTSSSKVEDPRRREQPPSRNSSGGGRDPRRRGASTNQESLHRGGQSDSSRMTGPNELYGRLPGPVKAVVDSMRREGRLQEPLNDNVITRLLHLPEHVALQAVENFSNVDLSQVENLQGFLVGIINRVNEKAIASEKQRRPQLPSPRGQSSSVSRSGHYGASVLGGPPQGGRLNANNGTNAGGYRAQAAPVTAGPGPALYERPYEAPQDPRDPRRRQSVPQGVPEYGAVRGPSSVNGGQAPIGMPSFTALPISVQNHVHSLVANHTLASLEELGGKCYEVLGQLSEPLANQVLARFAGANLSTVRNKSGFLIGVVKRARQEYGFN